MVPTTKTFHVVQGHYLQLDGKRVWKDWLSNEMTLKQAKQANKNFRSNGFQFRTEVHMPNDSRIVLRTVTEQVVT